MEEKHLLEQFSHSPSVYKSAVADQFPQNGSLAPAAVNLAGTSVKKIISMKFQNVGTLRASSESV